MATTMAVTSGRCSLTPRVLGSESGFDKLPNELLDWIFENTLPWRRVDDPLPERENWKTCTLVCRRWHEVIVRRLFDSVRIDPKAPGDVFDFYDFILSSPSTAQHVEYLSILDIEVHIWALAAILKLLPKVYSLSLHSITLRRKVDGRAVRGGFEIESLDYLIPVSQAHSHENRSATLDLLALFSEIGDLHIHFAPPSRRPAASRRGSYVEMRSRSLQNLKICSAEFSSLGDLEMPYVTLLNELDMFRHLTEFTAEPDGLLGLKNLDTQLCLLAPKLQSLTIKLGFCSYDAFIFPYDFEEYTRCLQKGLKACKSLRAFHLEIGSGVRDNFTEDLFDPSARVVEFISQQWEFAFRLAWLLPSVDQLEDFRFEYYFSEVDRPGLKYGYDELPWSVLRDTCRRFANLESIYLDFVHFHDEGDKEEADRYDARRAKWKKCAMDEMKEFKKILEFCSWQ